MRDILFSTFFVISLLFCNSANSSTIHFLCDKDISVKIMSPIDGAYNNDYASINMGLKKDVGKDCPLSITDFGCYKFLFSDGNRCSVFLFPNDDLRISYTNNQILFYGTNAIGQKYLNDNFIRKGLGFYFQKVDSIIIKNISDKIDFDEIEKTIDSIYFEPCQKYLNSLEENAQISEIMKITLLKDIKYALNGALYYGYTTILDGYNSKIKPTTQDSIIILNRIKEKFDNPENINENSTKYNFAIMLEDYYHLKWKNLSKDQKNLLMGDYKSDAFGPYIYYLTAPQNLQAAYFGNCFIDEMLRSSNSFDQKKLLSFMKEKFPNSGYLPIIAKLMNDQKISTDSTNNIKGIIIDGSKIKSLKDLSQVDQLRGKCLYIDLWATYCNPCKYEFQFNDDLYKLIGHYQNLVQIDISTDADDQDTNWRKMIGKYQLNCVNFRASEVLQKEISQRVYKGSPIWIPRYLLINSNAEILNDNLPRPSKLNELEEALNKFLKRN